MHSTADSAASAAAMPSVMVLGDHLGYAAGVVHGATIYFLDVLPALQRAGVELTVCFLREPHAAAERLRAEGVAPVFLSAARLSPMVVFRVAALVRRRRIGIIHAAGFKATLIARIVGRLTGARVILHLHDLLSPPRVVALLQRLFARPSDLAVCLSEAAREVAVSGYHVSPGRIRVVHNGVSLARFGAVAADARARIRAELEVPDASPLLGMIGRFFPIKGHRAMVQMMAQLVRTHPQAMLVFVGDGPERPVCEQLVRDLRIDANVRFAGQRSDVPELLSALDVVVAPSQSEGLGLAAIEALAAGRPVVAFDAGGLREVVTEGIDGYVVGAGDQRAFVAAVGSLIDERERRFEFGSRARDSAQRFSLERHIEKLLACYREAASAA